MSKCTEGWGSRLLIVREGSYTCGKGESGGAWWCWPGTGGLGVTWRGRDSRQALLASSTPGARILASPHGFLLEEPGSWESWQNPRLGGEKQERRPEHLTGPETARCSGGYGDLPATEKPTGRGPHGPSLGLLRKET